MAIHIVAWNYKEEIGAEERKKLDQERAEAFARLPGIIPGLKSARFVKPEDMLPGCTRDLMLVTEHETDEGIQVYTEHPAHQEAADRYVRPFVKDRICMNVKAL